MTFNFVSAFTIHSDCGAQENKICYCFHCFSFYLPWSDGTRCRDLSFLNVELYVRFSNSLSHSWTGSLATLHFLPLEWYHLHIWGGWYFSLQSWFRVVIHPTQNSAYKLKKTWWPYTTLTSVQFSSVTQSCPTLCDSMNLSTPGLPVHHQLPEFTQSHIHWGGDAIQPSHPLSSPSPSAPNPSKHQSLFQWVNSSHEVPKVQEFQL